MDGENSSYAIKIMEFSDKLKIIVFNCRDAKEQEKLLVNTQFSVVGDYLCHRIHTESLVWSTPLSPPWLKDEPKSWDREAQS